MIENIENNEIKLTKIYKINNIDFDDITYYGYSKNNLKNILNNYKSSYKKYNIDNVNNKYICIYKLFDKYGIDKIEINLIIECIHDEIKDNLYNIIKNDANSINLRFVNTVNDLKIKGRIVKKEWRKKNTEHILNYNKDYYLNNLDKVREYYLKNKSKVYERSLCPCGRNINLNHKASKLVHEHSLRHLNYLKTL